MRKGQNIIKCKRSFIHDQAEGKEPNQLMLRADTISGPAPLAIDITVPADSLGTDWKFAGVSAVTIATGAWLGLICWWHMARLVSADTPHHQSTLQSIPVGHCSLHSQTDNWDKPLIDDENQSRLSAATMELVSECKKYRQSFYWMIFLKLNTVQRLCKRWIGFLSTSALSSFNYFGMNWLNVWRAPLHSQP